MSLGAIVTISPSFFPDCPARKPPVEAHKPRPQGRTRSRGLRPYPLSAHPTALAESRTSSRDGSDTKRPFRRATSPVRPPAKRRISRAARLLDTAVRGARRRRIDERTSTVRRPRSQANGTGPSLFTGRVALNWRTRNGQRRIRANRVPVGGERETRIQCGIGQGPRPSAGGGLRGAAGPARSPLQEATVDAWGIRYSGGQVAAASQSVQVTFD